jgi:hypothetical protein
VGRGFRIREEAEEHAMLSSNSKYFQYSRGYYFGYDWNCDRIVF